MNPGDKIEVMRKDRPDRFRVYGIIQSIDPGSNVVLEGDSRVFSSVHYRFTVIDQFPWTSSVPGHKSGVKIMNEHSETKDEEEVVVVAEKVEGWEMTIESLRKMPMHLFMEVDKDVWVMRVVHGWVYQFKKDKLDRFFIPNSKVPELCMN